MLHARLVQLINSQWVHLMFLAVYYTPVVEGPNNYYIGDHKTSKGASYSNR